MTLLSLYPSQTCLVASRDNSTYPFAGFRRVARFDFVLIDKPSTVRSRLTLQTTVIPVLLWEHNCPARNKRNRKLTSWMTSVTSRDTNPYLMSGCASPSRDTRQRVDNFHVSSLSPRSSSPRAPSSSIVKGPRALARVIFSPEVMRLA